MTIQIAEYKDEYKNDIAELISHIQQNEYGIPITLADQPDLFTIPQFYQGGKGNFWVALHEKKVVGTTAVQDIGHDQLALKKVFVETDYRGKAFGTAALLLDKAIHWARNQEVKEILLGTTEQFKAAHRFYEKNGFKEIQPEDLPPHFPVLKVDSIFYSLKIK
ncbi:GNAT family N-acetyltransferase [Peribacillus kribbensis]|uniref:GNAT family N-acetyltransferase n=1 Tax=Peribacillus kribbensis TaxID=356658 RepID=UPI00040E80B2|nr:GNAT family N-acetyltransferase [Peribacillus kribbensis]